ncbi:dihydrodipicolinate synthase family protein [Nonomuraea sp. KC401]|uniref:Dihydrodipicolinate synthase family protein n=1 Tax=Nonomuraea longispora TaxID=1848320 RepID=A0A4V2XJI6_9ACTN|nr:MULTISPECIES: dihydrodipicolinate synthase family protein [Nonomuraea]NBE97567.1 dihydrodipicolinate synthase family protein [Nonomuraea sp. K271]TDC02746.1 dihydrodipicolinate synthase family protein [Nonomuraea longispora]TLF64087.1 dihydrodipicolinate synthase family protein [Nonomuraea sp. KC401]
MLGTAPEAHASVRDLFRRGLVIPAHPLALTSDRKLDERRQRALTRYYVEAGAGGLAVGVHTTQFAIHGTGLLAPVLELAATVAGEYEHDVVLVAGATGPTARAVAEAELARSLGYHMVLLSPYRELDEDGLIERARAVSEVLPVIGFYLQPAVGGRHLSREFWTRLAAIEAVVGIKAAPFDRYRTLDVLHGVVRAGRQAEVALYTGNDDHILTDLITPHRVVVDGREVDIEFVGGLLGQWAVWVRRAVELLEQARAARSGDDAAVRRLLTLDGHLTDANAAIFDSANAFRGCIPGIHEVLRRQGLLEGRWCLDPAEELSTGQLAEIDRVLAAYPALRDDDFVAENLSRWLA